MNTLGYVVFTLLAIGVAILVIVLLRRYILLSTNLGSNSSSNNNGIIDDLRSQFSSNNSSSDQDVNTGSSDPVSQQPSFDTTSSTDTCCCMLPTDAIGIVEKANTRVTIYKNSKIQVEKDDLISLFNQGNYRINCSKMNMLLFNTNVKYSCNSIDSYGIYIKSDYNGANAIKINDDGTLTFSDLA